MDSKQLMALLDLPEYGMVGMDWGYQIPILDKDGKVSTFDEINSLVKALEAASLDPDVIRHAEETPTYYPQNRSSEETTKEQPFSLDAPPPKQKEPFIGIADKQARCYICDAPTEYRYVQHEGEAGTPSCLNCLKDHWGLQQ